MNQLLQDFTNFLEKEDKQGAVTFALNVLGGNQIEIPDFYSQVLAPALNQMECSLKDKRICIWKEHVRTAIVRTVVECCYPFMIKYRDKIGSSKQGTAVVLCPPEEYHDLGARMVCDYFTILGYDTVFVGSNTPFDDFIAAVDIIHPGVIAISVSNYYNLVVTKRIVAELKSKIKHPFKILVGGNAFLENQENVSLIGADLYAQNFTEIESLVKGGALK